MIDLLNASALSKRLKVSCATVTMWAKAGVIPAEIHEGSLYRFDETRVREALAERARKRAEGGEG